MSSISLLPKSGYRFKWNYSSLSIKENQTNIYSTVLIYTTFWVNIALIGALYFIINSRNQAVY